MFKFTIRELLLLTLVVAMGVGWWLDHRNQRNIETQRAFAEFQRDGLAILIESRGHKVRLYNQWRVDLDDDSTFVTYDENLREVPWRETSLPRD